MSRRNNASRRRNYGRRQHEVRERRPSALGQTDWQGRSGSDDWTVPDMDQERPGSRDGYEGVQP